MIIARKLSLLASVVTYGCVMLISAMPKDAFASRPHSHHVSSRRHAKEDRQALATRSEHHRSRKAHRHEEADAVSEQRGHRKYHNRREQVAAGRPLTHRQRLALLRQQEIARQYALREHRIHLAEAAQQYRLHIARMNEYRKERLAELNGDISSKSIRAWQAYVANVPVRLISVDLNDPTIKVNALLAQDGIGSAEPFSRMIRRSQPDVAVTGTFFSLDNLKPVGDIVINGDLAYFGGMGTALCITPANHADIVTVPWGHHHDWSGYNFVLACGPRLLCDNQIVLDPAVEQFHDKHMLAKNSRIGVGITPGNKLVFVMTQQPIFLGRLAKIMRAVGCSQAMNLDAGTSTGFYYEGNMMARPGRWLTNAIVVYANQHNSPAST